MADIQKTIEIIFAGVDELGPTLEDIGGGITKVGDGVTKATQPLADMSDAVLLTTAAITALGVAALAFAAKEGIELENAFIELNKVLGDGDGVAQDYGDTFADLSGKFGTGQADVISLAADFKQAGFDIEESLKLVEDALTAAAISELSVDEAGATVIKTLNGFQAPAEEAGKLIDILNEASNTSAVSFGELALGMSKLSPIANQLGLSFEETAGLLTPVIEVFGSGSEAANGLRTALLKLGSESAPVLEALESVGIDTAEVITAKDRLAALSEVFPTLDEKAQSFVTTQIAGIEQAAKFSIVLSNQDAVLEATATAYGAAGSAAGELEIALASTEIALERFKNSFVNIAAAIGTEFLPQLAAVATSATDLNAAVLDSLSGDNFTKVFDALRGVFEALDAEIQGIAKAFPDAIALVDFTPILEGIDLVSGSLGDIFEGIDLTTPEGLAKAIQEVVDSLGSIATVAAGIISEFEGVVDIIGEGVVAFNDLSEEEKLAAGEALGFGKILNEAGEIISTVGGAIEGIGIALGVLAGATGISAVGTLFTGLTTLLGTFGTAAGAAGIASGVIGTAFTALATTVAALALPLTGIIALFAELNDQSISKFIDEVTDLSDKQAFAAESTETFGSTIGDLTTQMLEGEITIGEFNAKMAELNDAQVLAKFATEENTEANRENALSLLKTAEAIEEFNKGSADAVTSSEDLSGSLDEVASSSDKGINDDFLDRLTKAAEELDKTGKSAKDTANIFDENGNAVDEFGNLLGTAGEKAAEVSKELDSIDGKEVAVTVTAETNTAQQNLEKFQSVLSSLDNQVTSTGDTLVGLGSLFGDSFGNLDLGSQFAIKDAFRAEIEARQQALDLQNRLIETEIRLQEARLKAIESGDAKITIDTTGIEPILDLLLTTIIEQAQVRASVDGAAFLVGAL